ncbi:MAG: ribulose-phosphate 3-epimerase [Anaerolineales bacterium]|nr:ribulose-phosphate 3-epimerase [Anaerolineales bacterium]
MKQHLIAPSILAADFTRLGDQIRNAEEAGADWIHIDVMDGHFVPNLAMGPMIVRACKKVTGLPLDVHLMVLEPEKMLESYINAGANRLTVHIETCPHIHRTLQSIRELGADPGITLNPGTPVEAIREVIQMVDTILVMSVDPGFGGQSFLESSLQRIKTLSNWRNEGLTKALIEVDGGIDASSIQKVALAGADVFVAGSSIFAYPAGIQAGIDQLRQKLSAIEVQ